MKKHLLSALAATALLASCTKDSNVVVNPAPTPTPTTPAFRVEGVMDMTFEKTPFSPTNVMYQNLNVIYGTGAPQRVMLSLLNLPTGIQDSFSVRSGYPSFSSYLQLMFKNVANGSYNTTLVAKSDSATQNYPFTIKVSGDTSCNGYLTENAYTATSSCLGNTSYSVTLSKNGRTGDTFFVNNFRNTGISLMVLVSCRNSSVSIPAQTIGNVQYNNNGSFFTSTSNPLMIMLRTTEVDLSTGAFSSCVYNISRN